MTSQSGKQTISTNILSNISRSKDNQTMKLSQLIEYNMMDIFYEKSNTKLVKKLLPHPFLRNQN